MKALFLSLILLCAGCQAKAEDALPQNPHSANYLTQHNLFGSADTIVTEFCYRGVTWAKFSNGNSSWGGIVLDQNSKVIKCNSN